MRYVYLLQSTSRPDKRYVGITEDLKERLSHHNSGRSPHTSRFMPWQIVVAIRFNNDRKATAFERYLKSGSGRAFAARRLW